MHQGSLQVANADGAVGRVLSGEEELLGAGGKREDEYPLRRKSGWVEVKQRYHYSLRKESG